MCITILLVLDWCMFVSFYLVIGEHKTTDKRCTSICGVDQEDIQFSKT